MEEQRLLADCSIGLCVGEYLQHGQETLRGLRFVLQPQLPPSINWRKLHLPLFRVAGETYCAMAEKKNNLLRRWLGMK